MLRACSRLIGRAVIAAVVVASAGVGVAQVSGSTRSQLDAIELRRPIHFDDLRALRSFFERVDVTSVEAGVSAPRLPAARTLSAVLDTMPADWEAPFRFVQQAVRHVPYAGSVRGVLGTLEAGAGNALDQSLLLQSLMEARGVRTRLISGSLAWGDAALLVVGTRSPPTPRADDPWPRWLEAVADHWWLQAERDGEWVDLDPAFADVDIGVTRGRDGEPREMIPDDLQTRVHVELVRGDLTVAEAVVQGTDVVGRTISLSFAAESRDAVELWRALERVLGQSGRWLADVARRLGLLPSRRARAAMPVRGAPSSSNATAADAAPPALPPPRSRPSLLLRAFVDPEAGPWHAQLALPGRTLEAGPFEHSDLDQLVLRITVLAPYAPAHVLEAPWGGGAGGRLTVTVGAGTVSPERLATLGRAMYRSLDRLVTAEQAARVDMQPPIDYDGAVRRLSEVAGTEWERFATDAPEALGWVLLHAVEGAAAGGSAGRVVRPGLRLAAVRWRPPDTLLEGALEALMSDPLTVGQLTEGTSASSLRAAAGVLQSAVFSQVWNRLTDRAPDSAFDVTLRAVGTGRSLVPYREPDALPDSWSPRARAEATAHMAAGYRVLAPASFDGATAGWWDVSVADGEIVGWVPGMQTPLQSRVEMPAPGRSAGLEPLLASLPSLHRALRWLSELPGSGPSSLATVPAAACASATVAAEAMRRSMPESWPSPDVAVLCGAR